MISHPQWERESHDDNETWYNIQLWMISLVNAKVGRKISDDWPLSLALQILSVLYKLKFHFWRSFLSTCNLCTSCYV